jgi:hypothetical protein
MINATSVLSVANQFVVVAVVITAVSMLLYTLTFNLQDRVAQAMNVLLACVTLIYLGDVVASVATQNNMARSWLYCQWIGISMVPAGYLHFSDALLAKTGKPSRGRRRMVVYITYLLGLIACGLALYTGLVVQNVVVHTSIQWLRPGAWFSLFSVTFVMATSIAAINVYRAYLRCLTGSTRRRMGYLVISSLAVPIGVFPYLMSVGGSIVQTHPTFFWITSLVANSAVSVALVSMTYSVAFFGAPQPDRVIKARIFQWILRGPIVASLSAGAYLFVRWLDRLIGLDLTLWVPVAVVGVVLLVQYTITVIRLPVERQYFYGNASDREDVKRLQMLGERLLTTGDLKQFLESVLAAACDVLHISSGFVAAVGHNTARIQVQIGPHQLPTKSNTLVSLLHAESNSINGEDSVNINSLGTLEWEGYWIIPLRTQHMIRSSKERDPLMGMLGLYMPGLVADVHLSEEFSTLQTLVDRATTALEDRLLQVEVFRAMDKLLPQVEELQRMRAAASYAGVSALTSGDLADNPDAAQWVKSALGHFWGGPRLSESPLMSLNIVKQAQVDHQGNAVHALREVLKNAIDDIKPDGQRRFTAEWLLYNLLELKFLQGLRVRDVAMRLSVSEADLYRKQRVAVDQVLKRISQMEGKIDETVRQQHHNHLST